MAKTLHRTFAALLCGAVCIAGPAVAAGAKVGATHHATHALKHAVVLHHNKLADVDLMERRMTAELNRAAFAKTAHGDFAAVIIPDMVALADTDDDALTGDDGD